VFDGGSNGCHNQQAGANFRLDFETPKTFAPPRLQGITSFSVRAAVRIARLPDDNGAE
jgi:hypothetical protein